MPMFTEEVVAPPRKSVRATPSLATDLSWLLSVAARPSMQTRYPKLAEIFDGREDLAARVHSFWSDATDEFSSEEMCFTEMQVLVQQAGVIGTTDPDVLWAGIEAAGATVPLARAMPSETPEDRAIFLHRFEQLRQSPALLRSYLDLLEEVWAPVDAMWHDALPILEETG